MYFIESNSFYWRIWALNLYLCALGSLSKAQECLKTFLVKVRTHRNIFLFKVKIFEILLSIFLIKKLVLIFVNMFTFGVQKLM